MVLTSQRKLLLRAVARSRRRHGVSFLSPTCNLRAPLHVQVHMRRKISTEIWTQVDVAIAAGIGAREIGRNMGIPEGAGASACQLLPGPDALFAMRLPFLFPGPPR